MSLHVEVRGDGPPLVLLHGFTQTGRLWGPFGDALAQRHQLICVDLPGHGGSDEVRADLNSTAVLVAEAVRIAVGEAAEPCGLLGYSLGARVALHVLTGRTLRVGRAVLIGATGGIEDPEARGRRRAADEARADDLEASGDVRAFIDAWLRGPLFSSLGEGADAKERLRNSASGLASSLRLAGTGSQEPLWDRLHEVDAPLMALAGSNDERFAGHATRIANSARHACATLVPGGGHAVHLAQPQVCATLVERFFGVA